MSHTISLELAKKMKELGFEQKSTFYWTDENLVLMPEYPKSSWRLVTTKGLYHQAQYISAYLVDELSRIILYSENSQIYKISFVPQSDGKMLCLGYDSYNEHPFFSETMPDSLALMAIYLKEQKII